MRILIAEDERDLNRIISSRLSEEHYSVDSCFDGEEALEYLESAAYDAVVLDIMMPKKDGLSVLRELRAKGSKVPVLLLTARSSVDDRVSGLDAGADHLGQISPVVDPQGDHAGGQDADAVARKGQQIIEKAHLQ